MPFCESLRLFGTAIIAELQWQFAATFDSEILACLPLVPRVRVRIIRPMAMLDVRSSVVSIDGNSATT